MRSKRAISIVGVHCEGEVGDVITGGVLDPTHCKTMWDKLVHFRDHADDVRQLLMQEPRGRVSQCMNMILAPCNPAADAGFLVLESDEYPPMSGSNTICTTTVLLETGMIEINEPVTEVKLDTPAGLITVEAECVGCKCTSVAFTNVPSFVYVLDHMVEVPGIGIVPVDIAWGGMHYAIVDVASVGLRIRNEDGPELELVHTLRRYEGIMMGMISFLVVYEVLQGDRWQPSVVHHW
ncbi:proline racemase-domain-containing protein [Elsinoe ampelina]|uniref:Proline racemase-domain-containing protein n=1 Tax=Elsinoe ampelina TaxID=302913 RepID=A0A6A6G1F6_9PEZI|nr:proline racemase-domain-containing protein [Elsinoe ampelina]